MNQTIFVVLFYLLLIDSLGANWVAWCAEGKWYRKNLRIFSRYFPIAKGWTGLYLVLVLFIGYILNFYGAL